MTPTDHPTDERLTALLERDPGALADRGLGEHVAGCPACTIRVRDLERIGTALRGFPLSAAPRELSAVVLGRLGIQHRDSFLFRVLERAALGVGMLIVLGTVAAVFLVSGVITTEQVTEGGTTLGTWFAAAGGWIGGAGALLTQGIERFAPFLADARAAGITASMLAVAALLAGADRIFGRRIPDRGRPSAG